MGSQSAAVLARAPLDREHPWPGLDRFREGDRDLFFGRDDEIDAVHALVERERVAVLYSPSGLGKTSLIQAGLFPRLREKAFLPVSIRLDFTPQAPPATLQVWQAVKTAAASASVETPSFDDGATLWEGFHRRDADFWGARNQIVTPVLVLDQFEELFTLGRSSAEQRERSARFVSELADLVEGRVPRQVKQRLDENPEQASHFEFGTHRYKLLLALREDFLPELEELRERMPSIAHARMRLKRMSGTQALQVVVGAGAQLVDRQTGEAIVRFVAGIDERSTTGTLEALGVEPALLSLVCRELNDRRIAEGLVKISSSLLEGARREVLRDFYEKTVADVSQPVRRFVEDRLLTEDGFRTTEAVQNALKQEGVTREALDRLVDRRLLRQEDRLGIPHIELIHDVVSGVVRESRDGRREEERRRGEAALRQRRILIGVTGALALFLVILVGAAIVAQQLGSRAKAREAARLLEEEAHKLNVEGDWQGALRLWAHSYDFADEGGLESASLRVALRRTLRFTEGQIALLEGHSGRVSVARFSPDGNLVLTAGQDGTARLWSVPERPAVETRPPGSGEWRLVHEMDRTRPRPCNEGEHDQEAPAWGVQYPIDQAFFSADGERILLQGEYVSLWDTSGGCRVLELPSTFIDAHLSPDGSRIVTVNQEGWLTVWSLQGDDARDPADSAATELFQLTDEDYESARFDPSGKFLATHGVSTGFRDASTGEELAGIAGSSSRQAYVSVFGPDGKQVAASWPGGSTYVADFPARDGLPTKLQDAPRVDSLRFSPDGSRLLTVHEEVAPMLWDAESGRLQFSLVGHAGSVTASDFSADSSRILTADSYGNVIIGESDSGLTTHTFFHGSAVLSAGIHPDGEIAVTAARDGTVRVWGLTGRTIAKEPRLLSAGFRQFRGPVWVQDVENDPDTSTVIALSSDGKLFVVAGDQGAEVRDASAGELRHRLAEGQIDDASFSPDGTLVVTAGEARAQIWDVKSGRLLHTLGGREGDSRVVGAIFSPDGSRIATAGLLSDSGIWEVRTGRRLLQLPGGGNATISLDFNPEGTRLVTVEADLDLAAEEVEGTAVLVWDLGAGERLFELIGHDGHVTEARFSPDGARIATASEDGTARVWDASTGKQQATLEHEDDIELVTFSPDGQRVLTGCVDGRAGIWTVSGEMLRSLSGHAGPVRHAEFSTDGESVLTTDPAGERAFLWDARTGRRLAAFRGTEDRHLEIARLDPDGERVLLAGSGRISAWSLRTIGDASLRRGHAASVDAGTFSPDGRFLATGSRDGKVKVWDVKDADLVAELGGHAGGPLFVGFTDAGARLVTADRAGSVRIWGAENGSQLSSFEAETYFTPYTSGFGSSDDGKSLSTIGSDFAIGSWSLADGQRRSFAALRGDPTAVPTVTSVDYLDDAILVEYSDRRLDVWSSDGAQPNRRFDNVFDIDGSLVARENEDGLVEVIDLVDGQIRLSLEVARILAGFDADGRFAVVIADEKGIELQSWNVDAGQLHASISMTGLLWLEGSKLSTGQTSSDIQRAAGLDDDDVLHLLDLRSGQEIASHPLDEGAEVFGFSPDGQLLLTSSGGTAHDALVWDADDGRLVTELEGPVEQIEFLPDGRRVITRGGHSRLRVWDATTGSERAVLRGEGQIDSVQLSPDGQYIAAYHVGGITIWDATSYSEISSLDSEAVDFWRFGPGSTRVIGGTLAWVAVWEVASGRQLARIEEPYPVGEHGFALSPDEKRLVTASDSGAIKVWSATDGELLRTISQGLSGAELDQLIAWSLSKAGPRVVTAPDLGGASLWDAKQGVRIATLGSWGGDLVRFSRNGRFLLEEHLDGTATVWDAANGARVSELGELSDWLVGVIVESADFSPDAALVVRAGLEFARVWRTETGELLATMEWETGNIASVAFNPDGEFIVSVTDRRAVDLWRSRDGRLVQGLRLPAEAGEDPRVKDSSTDRLVTFSPDGSLLAIGWEDGTVELWNITPEDRDPETVLRLVDQFLPAAEKRR